MGMWAQSTARTCVCWPSCSWTTRPSTMMWSPSFSTSWPRTTAKVATSSATSPRYSHDAPNLIPVLSVLLPTASQRSYIQSKLCIFTPPPPRLLHFQGMHSSVNCNHPAPTYMNQNRKKNIFKLNENHTYWPSPRTGAFLQTYKCSCCVPDKHWILWAPLLLCGVCSRRCSH